MAIEQGYPVQLVHPNYRPAKIVQGDEPGSPELFPAVMVNGSVQESEYRVRGYLRFGEPAPAHTDYHEYPKTLRHPKYVPAQEARIEMRIENGRPAGTFTVAAIPAVMPDVIVLNKEQEDRARANGYKPAGEYNRGALESILVGTPSIEQYKPAEYPKWVGEELIEKDPRAVAEPGPDEHEYPRIENGVLVQDPNVPPPPDPHRYPMWVHRDGIPSEESALANNPAEEAAIRDRWKPPVRAKEKVDEAAEA